MKVKVKFEKDSHTHYIIIRKGQEDCLNGKLKPSKGKAKANHCFNQRIIVVNSLLLIHNRNRITSVTTFSNSKIMYAAILIQI
jgi:hypothetical protein